MASNSISTFCILSQRGDTIISREYRDDCGSVHRAAETFFRIARFGLKAADNKVALKGEDGEEQTGLSSEEREEAPPVFELDGVSYISTKTSGLYFLCTTKYNVSPNMVLELLSRLAKSFRDFCGILTEESIRKNFVLVYELLDEVLDFGFPQQTSTEVLKQFVWNEPVAVTPSAASFKVPTLSSSGKSRIAPSSSVNKSVLAATSNRLSSLGFRFGNVPVASSLTASSGARNEIFVDILERVTCLFSASGILINSEVDGSIVMKSFLINNPELRVTLNEDLVIGKQNMNVYSSQMVLDDANFHECVRLDEFEEHKSLVFVPPEGEFVLMNYRVTGGDVFRPPFRIAPVMEEISPTQLDVFVRVRADIPHRNYGSSVKVKFPVPKTATGVSLQTGRGADAAGQSAEFHPQEHCVVWTIKKFAGGSELSLRARITLKETVNPSIKREVGPISMEFEIPMLSTSNLQVRTLRTTSGSAQNPSRWVRYITQSASYVCRLTS
jgi:AP-4 complex subunit mu-1